MDCSTNAQDFVADSFPEVTFPTDSNEEFDEDVEYLTFEDGTRIKIGAIDIDDVVFDNLEENIIEYGSLRERNEDRVQETARALDQKHRLRKNQRPQFQNHQQKFQKMKSTQQPQPVPLSCKIRLRP